MIMHLSSTLVPVILLVLVFFLGFLFVIVSLFLVCRVRRLSCSSPDGKSSIKISFQIIVVDKYFL